MKLMVVIKVRKKKIQEMKIYKMKIIMKIKWEI